MWETLQNRDYYSAKVIITGGTGSCQCDNRTVPTKWVSRRFPDFSASHPSSISKCLSSPGTDSVTDVRFRDMIIHVSLFACNHLLE